MSSGHYRTSHTRSASWSPQRDLLENSLSEPLRSVLREYVPGALMQESTVSNSQSRDAAVNIAEEEDEESPESPGYLDFTACLSIIKKILPFVVLLLLRWLWEHRTGIFVLIGLFLAFLHFNKTIIRNVSLRDRRHVTSVVANMLFLALNVHIVYYVFHKEHLYRCLYFMSPVLDNTVWDVMWAVGITDFMVKFVVMLVKCVCVIQWRCLVPYKTRGKWYMLLENISHFYRILLPFPRWISFFMEDNQGLIMSLVLCGAYIVIKVFQVFSKVRKLWQVVRFFFKDQYYGTLVSKSELSDSQCPICQEDIEEPIMLHCKHVFCDECITSWFDRHPTCPMCRARITTAPPIWRDGSTSAFVQFF